MRPKKRSAYVGFSVMTLSAALAGCGPQTAPDAKDVRLYHSISECARENGEPTCDYAWTQADAEHRKDAPQFRDRKACEADWGDGSCEEARGGGGVPMFVPAMAGFMLGRAMAPRPQDCGTPGAPACPPARSGGGAHGVYFGRGGGLFSGRERIGDAEVRGGSYDLPRTASVSESAGGRISGGRTTRGGFGRFAGFHGFGGHGGGGE